MATLIYAAQFTKALRKIALLVGIFNYEDSRSWKSISSLNDLKYLNTALLQQGFTQENIYILKEEAAIHAVILNAMDDLAGKTQRVI